MIFSETKFDGVFVVDPERLEDERGFFARTFSEDEFRSRRLNLKVVQCNVSFNKKRATLRGMHYQVAPFEEGKLVRCTMGAIYDVVIDLRPDSSTYMKWLSVELTAENRQMLHIPKGLAHGFQTLEDNSEVFYQMSEVHHPSSARGIRWDDPAFTVDWPHVQDRIISEKDLAYPDFGE